MNHDEFYSIGKGIVSQNGSAYTEIELRTAIGRIYYYIYHEVLDWVQHDEYMKDFYFESEVKSSHKKLINVFYEMAKKTRNLQYGKIHRLLSTLHTYRCSADYQLRDSINKDLFDSFEADLDDLKEACLLFKTEIFSIIKKEQTDILSSLKTENAIIHVRKPKLKLLD